MKLILLVVCLIAAGTVAMHGQTNTTRQDFEKNKAKYTREHFVVGEDASSGYDYLFYKSAGKIVKIRSIWSASHSKELRIEDFYFDGATTIVHRLTGRETQLNALKKGRNVPLKQKDELHFTDSKLVTWIKDGKAIERSDPQWANTEKSELEHARAELENYDFLKDNN
jgi:hypothetical protein